MSLADSKSSLFGKAPSVPSKTGSATPISAGGGKKLEAVSTIPISTSLSGASRAKKLEEAQEWSEKARKHLKTSVFQWSPDYLAAAPCFENASNAYKLIGEFDLARDCLVQSAEANEKAGCLGAASLTYSKIAQLCQVNFLTCSELIIHRILRLKSSLSKQLNTFSDLLIC